MHQAGPTIHLAAVPLTFQNWYCKTRPTTLGSHSDRIAIVLFISSYFHRKNNSHLMNRMLASLPRSGFGPYQLMPLGLQRWSSVGPSSVRDCICLQNHKLISHKYKNHAISNAIGWVMCRKLCDGNQVGTRRKVTANGLAETGWLDPECEARARHAMSEQGIDAIIILGGGLRRKNEMDTKGEIPAWACRRLDAAAHVYHNIAKDILPEAGMQQSVNSNDIMADKKPCIVISGGGSPHGLPVIGDSGQVVHEGTAYAEYLMEHHGIPASMIFKESSSYDTVGNAYFSAVIHTFPRKWENVAVITSSFHMPRSKAIFETVYRLAAATFDCGGHDDVNRRGVNLVFLSASDDGLFSEDILQARIEKEMDSKRKWEGNTGRMTTLTEFHEWMYQTHLCYAVSRQGEFGRQDDLNDALKGTY